MSKTYYTEDAWRLAAVEDPRNPSFQIIEITLQITGDTLIVTESEYADIEDNLPLIESEEDDEYLEQRTLEGDEYFGDLQQIFDIVKVYKVVD